MVAQASLQNRLLSRAPPADFAMLAGKLVPCTLRRNDIVSEANTQLKHAYFLEDGMASIGAESPEGQVTEAGVVGREGFLHPAVVLGSDTIPFKLQIQMAGHGHRVLIADLLQSFEQSVSWRRTLLLFAQINTVQGGFSTLSNAVHQIDERLARWLLMCHDRSSSDDLALTHEFMSIMLSVRRPSVTNTLHVLEGNGFIKNERGYVTIRNRAALEEFAGDAYGKPEAEYRRLLGPL